MVKGKPFTLDKDAQAELNSLGLTKSYPVLKAERDADKKPPGKPSYVNGAAIYPARHFG